jgi:hypothetical protein
MDDASATQICGKLDRLVERICRSRECLPRREAKVSLGAPGFSA